MDTFDQDDIIGSLLSEDSVSDLIGTDLSDSPDPMGLTTIAWSLIVKC